MVSVKIVSHEVMGLEPYKKIAEGMYVHKTERKVIVLGDKDMAMEIRIVD